MYKPAVAIIGTRCHYCQKYYSPREILRFGESIDMCLRCHEKHVAAMEALATGQPPKECAACNKSWLDLRDESLTENVPMYFHMDPTGAGFMLCKDCDARWILGHKEMYRPTWFGWDQKI